jgi:hypothetical protein
MEPCRPCTGAHCLRGASDLRSLARAVLPLISHLELRIPTAPAHQDALAAARAALRDIPGYPLIVEAVGAERAEAVTLLLFAMTELVTPVRQSALSASLGRAVDAPTLDAELASLRAQLTALLANGR